MRVSWKRYDFHVELTRKCFHFHEGFMEVTRFPCEFHGNVMITTSKDVEVRRFPETHMEIESFPCESTWNIFSRVLHPALQFCVDFGTVYGEFRPEKNEETEGLQSQPKDWVILCFTSDINTKCRLLFHTEYGS